MESRLFVMVVAMLASCVTAERNILVFGGNGFIGAATVEKLLEKGDVKITIANRGNWYWDSATRILPRVTHVKCDRLKEDQNQACPDLIKLVNETTKFDAVYDFSSYGPEETETAVKLLKGKVGLYILISTDSIYDVCVYEKGMLSLETEDVRPDDEAEQERLAEHHPYGHRKLQSEEVMRNQQDDPDAIPYVILRLPDVLGPRDSTYRFWVYDLWLRLAPRFPDHRVHVPYFLKDYAISFVYVDDVANLAVKLLEMNQDDIVTQAFNLAWPETQTLEELLRTMDPEGSLNIDEKGTTNYFYPSVRRGAISVKKAQEVLGWQTTPFEEAIRESKQFYENAMKDERFMKQRDEIIQIVHNHMFYDDSTKYYQALEEIYGLNLSHFHSVKDEL